MFTPRHPNTRPQVEVVRAAESVLDIEGLMAKSMAGVRRFRIKNDGTMREILPKEPKEEA